jgi:hypothetical protein
MDKNLQIIEYKSPLDIVELHRSMNMARITPDGKSPENSSAFILALNKSGEISVYVPCLLAESGRILMYIPDRQPQSEDDLGTIISAAVDFIEKVGFMMEAVSLPSDTKARAGILKDIPVISQLHTVSRKKGLAA